MRLVVRSCGPPCFLSVGMEPQRRTSSECASRNGTPPVEPAKRADEFRAESSPRTEAGGADGILGGRSQPIRFETGGS